MVSEDQVIRAPEGIPSEISASLLKSAGLAYRLLADFAPLKSGDFIMQNDASSAVGLAVLQLCKSRGIKTSHGRERDTHGVLSCNLTLTNSIYSSHRAQVKTRPL